MAYDDPNTPGYAPGPNEPPDATMYASPPAEGYDPHPLFPLDHDGRDHRDIQFISFRRRRSSDGAVEHCPEDIPAGEIQSWADVVAMWGGGEYKAIAKNRHHRILAFCPPNPGDWMLFDTESKPFALRNPSRHRHSPPVPAAPPAPAAAPTPPPNPATPASAPASPFDLARMELLREIREDRARQQPPSDPAVVELLREIREDRARQQPPSDPAVVELLREIREGRARQQPPSDPAVSAMAEMVKALTMVLVQRQAEPRPKVEPTTVAVELLKAMREWAPQAPPQPSVTDRLSEYRQIRDLTTPTTPAAPAPPLSEFGELKDLFASVMQADMLTKTTREPQAPPPPPPPAIERRLPPRRPLVHVPGVGLVDIVEPEPPPRTRAPELDLDALLSDPVQRARVLKRLTDERLGAAPRDPQSAEPAPTTAAPEPIAAVPAPPTAVPEPIAAVPAPPMAAPEPIAAVPAPPTAAPEPIAAVPAPPTATPEPIAAVPAPPTATPEPIAAVPAPATAVPEPIATEPASSKERLPIGLPARMPANGSRPITKEDCERAVHSLRTFSRMPPDRQRAELNKLPGIGSQSEEMMTAMNALPPEAWPAIVANLPSEVVRVLLDGPGG